MSQLDLFGRKLEVAHGKGAFAGDRRAYQGEALTQQQEKGEPEESKQETTVDLATARGEVANKRRQVLEVLSDHAWHEGNELERAGGRRFGARIHELRREGIGGGPRRILCMVGIKGDSRYRWSCSCLPGQSCVHCAIASDDGERPEGKGGA